MAVPNTATTPEEPVAGSGRATGRAETAAGLDRRAPAAGTGRRGAAAGQLQFEGMPRRLYPAYPSRLTTWLDCPRRFRMAYLDRPPPAKGPPWAHNSLGASIHLALAAWWRLPLPERTSAAAGRLLGEVWLRDGYRDANQSAEMCAWAAGVVGNYVKGLDPADEPIGVERVVATRTEVVALSGRVDRIDQRGDELVVVDYKTGRHVLSADDARGSLALAAYALAAERTLHRRCRRAELHHLPSGTIVEWTYSDDALDRHLHRIDDIAAECRAAEETLADGPEEADRDRAFPPRVGPQCAWCDFARHCPEGTRAFSTRQPWAGLPDL